MDITPIIFQIAKALWFIFPIALVATTLKSNWFKGMIGEFIINAATKLFLDKETYRLIKNVTLPTKDGTTQIDHIIVSIYGVFVVETKNMKGWLFGTEHQKTWTQQIFKHKSKFQNPLLQNYKHIKTLQTLLNLSDRQLHSVIVFIGDSTFKTKMPRNVTYGMGYLKLIKSKQTPVLSQVSVEKIIESIEKQRFTPSRNTHKAHVEHVTQSILHDYNKKQNNNAGTQRLSSSKIAKKHKLTTKAFIQLMEHRGYLVIENDKHRLTDEGKAAGGQHITKSRYGPYFIWPVDIELW